MVNYYYQFNNTEEVVCYFNIVDEATSNYGCFVVDDFRANLDEIPAGTVIASSEIR